MPKILNYGAPWLSRPSPWFGLFHDEASTGITSPRPHLSAPKVAQTIPYSGPRRLIAQRGTEVFTVVGKQVRWADLATLKSEWDEQGYGHDRDGRQSTQRSNQFQGRKTYQTLNVSIHQDIRQIILSPSGHFLAILTTNTVYLAPLPHRSHLQNHDGSPLKLTASQIGRTTHCLGRSAVITALWHPLAFANNHQDCLITITTDAIVRLWEVDLHNKSTLDNPTLAVDLKKLIDGSSCDDDFAPSQFGYRQGYSPDIFDMEVASACFGGQKFDDEDGWASMTLWVAMRNGDVYALCPLLPSRWTPSSTCIPSLSTSVVSKMAIIGDNELDPEEAKALRQQYQWVLEIDNEQPASGLLDSDSGPSIEIRKRPSNPSPIPRLQGPFDLDLPEDEQDEFEITDIHVIPARLRSEDAYEDDEEDVRGQDMDKVSATIVCVSTSRGKVLICLNLDVVEGQWLPKTKKGAFTVPDTDFSEMTVIDSIDGPSPSIAGSETQIWPTFTTDPVSPYAFFLTTASTVQYYSLTDWIPRLESELSGEEINEGDNGLAFRLKVLCETEITLHEEVLRLDSKGNQDASLHLSQSLVSESYELGYFLLTATAEEPYSVFFDEPSPNLDEELVFRALPPPTATEAPLPDPAPARPAYAPAPVFYNPPASAAVQKLGSQIPTRHKAILKQEIRMSPLTLDIMTNAHRVLSTQTAALERSAVELFRRVERLRSEIRDAVEQMVVLADRVQQLHENNTEGGDKGTVEERIFNVGTKQEELNSRFENLRRKAAKVGHTGDKSKELNAKEVAWAEEINGIGKRVGLDESESAEDETATLRARYERVKTLTTTLLSQIKSIQSQSTSTPSKPSPSPRPHPPPLPRQQSTPADPILPQRFPNDAPAESSLQKSLHQNQPEYPRLPSTSSDLRPVTPQQQQQARPGSSGLGSIGSKLQRAKIAEAMGLVEREGAVIEGAMRRLERLSLGEL